jgi:hypothetical protein
MVEEAPYEETGTIGKVELRKYPMLRVATVSGSSENEAFGILFRYISGKNRAEQKIAMTAPVLTSEQIEMTAPVLSDSGSMSFVLPSRYAEEDPPEPEDPRVQIRTIPPREVAVLRFKGYADPPSVAANTQQLLLILEQHNISTESKPFLMRYNAPIVPGFLRRNEVGVEIRHRAP